MSVTTPRGFRAAGVAAGLKSTGKPDLAVVVNDGPDQDGSRGVHLEPVLRSARDLVAPGRRGPPTACGGAQSGWRQRAHRRGRTGDSAETAHHLAEQLGVDDHDVAVCSTGLIASLPMDKILTGVDEAVVGLSGEGGMDAANAIITTDTHAKTAVFQGDGWTLAAWPRARGMLAPQLATMLVVITTDLSLTADQARAALTASTEVSFNRLDSDGCMSTNDSVLLLASGASGITPDTDEFTAALAEICLNLGHQLLGDAEGSSHDITIHVVNAASERDALVVGRSIAASNLFKCAIFGNDPNWGRVLSSMGTTDAGFEPSRVDVSFNGVMLCRGGEIGDDRALVDLSPRECTVVVDLHAGSEQAIVWTNDLTYDYVRENAEYSS